MCWVKTTKQAQSSETTQWDVIRNHAVCQSSSLCLLPDSSTRRSYWWFNLGMYIWKCSSWHHSAVKMGWLWYRLISARPCRAGGHLIKQHCLFLWLFCTRPRPNHDEPCALNKLYMTQMVLCKSKFHMGNDDIVSHGWKRTDRQFNTERIKTPGDKTSLLHKDERASRETTVTMVTCMFLMAQGDEISEEACCYINYG